MDRRKKVLNFQEAAVDRPLADYAAETGHRINLKMRLRDAIDIEGLDLTARERNSASAPRRRTALVADTDGLDIAVFANPTSAAIESSTSDPTVMHPSVCRRPVPEHGRVAPRSRGRAGGVGSHRSLPD